MSLFWFARVVLKSIHAMFMLMFVARASRPMSVWGRLAHTPHRAAGGFLTSHLLLAREAERVPGSFLYSPYLPFITVAFRHHLAALHAAIAATFEIDRRTTACPRSIAVLPLAPAAQLQHLLYGPCAKNARAALSHPAHTPYTD